MRDFTLHTYQQLLSVLKKAGYKLTTLEDYVTQAPTGKVCILRHDVDARPRMSATMAHMEQENGVRATYFFRAPEMYGRVDPADSIRDVVKAGHELGYHYEDHSLAQGDDKEARELFEEHLAYLRQFYPVRTIAAHGSPRSAFDNKDLWDFYDYKQDGIICEPYIDLDYHAVLYLTDTGRRWDGFKMAVRDKIPFALADWAQRGWIFHSTNQIIEAARKGLLPDQLLLSTHPQRWTNNPWLWWHELMWQNIKNYIKKAFYMRKK